MSVETKQCSICVDGPPYYYCVAHDCAYVVSLQAALREALERWEELHRDFVAAKTPNRVQQLRAQFLDDK